MSDITPNKMRAFLIQSRTVDHNSLWLAESSYTHQASFAGIPKPQQSETAMTIQATGSQDQDITIETQRGGTPGQSATFQWKGEDSINLGKDWSNLLTDWEYWDYSSSTAKTVNDSHCVSDRDGYLYVISEKYDATNQYTVYLRRKYRDEPIQAIRTFITKNVIGGMNTAHPALHILEDGSLMLIYATYTAEDLLNFAVWRSIDNGSNWTKITNRALVNDIDVSTALTGYDIDKIRLVESQNVISMFVSLVSNDATGARNRLAQYRSLDQGLTFSLVGDVSAKTEGYFHQAECVRLSNGAIGVAWIDSSTSLKFTAIPNSSIRASNSTWLTDNEKTIFSSGTSIFCNLSSFLATDGSLAMWEQDNMLFVAAKDIIAGSIVGFYSKDDGATWSLISDSTQSFVTNFPDALMVDMGYSANQITNITATQHEGRAVVIGHYNLSSSLFYFGGWSSFGFPKTTENPIENDYMHWDNTWLPLITPDTSSQYTTSGAGSFLLTQDGLQLSTSSNIRYYSYTGPSGTYFSEGQVFRMRLKVTQSNGTVGDYIAFKATQDSGSFSNMLNLRFETTGFVIRDNASVLQSVSWDMTQETELAIIWKDGKAYIHHRHADQDQAKKWNENLVNPSKYGTGAGNTVQWGHIALSLNPLESYWQEFHISSGKSAGLPSSNERRSPIYPSLGDWLYLDGGMYITTQGNPARGQEEYKASPRYKDTIDNIFQDVSASPSILWKSKDDSTTNQIAWYIDPIVQEAAKSRHQSDVWGIHLSNINFKTANIKRWDTGSSSWLSIGTLETSEGMTGTFTRAGNSIYPGNTTKPFYLHYGECAGWYVELSVIRGTNYIVPILHNSEGVWDNNTPGKKAILTIDSSKIDPTTLPLSGLIEIMPTNITVTISALGGVNGGDAAIAIEIPTQKTHEGYFQIGSMIYGDLVFPAPQYQRGRTITYTPNVTTQTTRDGKLFGRKFSKGSRSASIAWTEPIDTTRIQELNLDYWQLSQSTGAEAIANYGDAPYQLMGLYQTIENLESMVWLPEIERSTLADPKDIQVFNRYHNQLLCRSTGEITIESVLGEEGESELFRVTTINIREVE